MENIINKISSYNLLNNMLPGSMFCYAMDNLLGIDILKDDIILNLFLFYFTGMIVSRVGSVIIEPLLTKCKFIKREPYDKYLSASSKDHKIEVLLETNNIYRSILGMCATLFICKMYILASEKFLWLNSNLSIIVIVIIFTLFIFAYKKQTKYITDRIKIANKR